MPKFSADAIWLLEVLTWRLRVVADVQLDASGLVSTNTIDRLLLDKLIGRARLNVPIYRLQRPLYESFANARQPDFTNLAWQLRRRHQHRQPAQVNVFWATHKAVEFFGGTGGRIRQPLQVAHDLGTASTFFARTRVFNSLADNSEECWLSEDVVRSDRILAAIPKVPDAVIHRSGAALIKAIEFGGQYSAARLRQLHACWSRARIPYELW